MAPVDWKSILDIDPDDINDENVDDHYAKISEIEVESSEVKVENIVHLFNVTKALMIIKHETSETYYEELTAKAASEGQLSAKEESRLKEQVEELEKELDRMKAMSSSDLSKDARKMREKLLDVEAKAERLQQELTEEVQAHDTSRRKLERTEKDKEEAEKQAKELKKENDQMRDDMREFQRQLENQRDDIMSKRGADSDIREQLQQKNQDLIDQLDEIKNLSIANRALQDEVAELTRSLEVSIAEMEAMTSAHNKIKAILSHSDVTVDQLSRENEILQEKIDELEERVNRQREGDDEIMAAVGAKIEQWKEIVCKKDEEIQSRDKELTELRDRLNIAGVDLDRQSYASLQAALKAKDADIHRMLEQINDANVELEEYRKELEDMKGDGGGATAKYLSRISELKSKVKELETSVKEAKDNQRAAERDSANKDKDLAEAESRLAAYEAGEYGLSDAVLEIKQLKGQVRLRDNNVEQLIGQMNQLELKMNSVHEENEGLRAKLGLEPGEPIDLSHYHGQRAKRDQQDRAMNIILMKEVEKLEEERVALKKQVRSLAMDKAQRAAALGLTADDALKIDEFTERLKTGGGTRNESFFNTSPRKPNRYDTSDIVDGPTTVQQQSALAKDLSQFERRADSMEVDRNNYRARCEDLQADNAALCEVIRELKNNDRLGESSAVESVEKLLSVLEARHADGAYDSNLQVKARLDQLTGRNEELRHQLRDLRATNNSLTLTNDRIKYKLERAEEDLKEVRETGMVQVQQMKLPDGVAPSSSDVIASLNEHLVLTIQELSNKEGKLTEVEEALQKYRSQFAVARHQLGLVYKEYKEKRDAWEAEKKKMLDEKENLEGLREADLIKIEEFKRLQDALAQSPDELRQTLSEVNRRITVLRVNERALIRRHALQRQQESHLRAENTRLDNELVLMEANVMKRIGYLDRWKSMSLYRMEALQKAMGECVAESDYERVQADLNRVTLKYRDLLEKENHLVAKSAAVTMLEVEVSKLKETLAETKKDWSADKEKLHTLQSLVEKSEKALSDSAAVSRDNSEVSGKSLAMLEMKCINETQRAEHATRLYEYQKSVLKDLEERNTQLEHKFTQLTTMSIEAQQAEAKIRDELAQSVSKEVHDAANSRIAALEKTEAYHKVEVSKLREMVDIANLQVTSMALHQKNCDNELESMRELVMDLQKDSDHNKALGKLHHDKVNLQNKEGTLLMKMQKATERLRKLEASNLRLEQKIDEKDNIMYHSKVEWRNRSLHLKKSLAELRRKYTGCLPLEKQEKFSEALQHLHEERARLQKEVHDAEVKRIDCEDEMLKVKEQHRGLQELMKAIKDNKGAAKVAEWHAKMTDMRLHELKARRELERTKEKVRYMERLLAQHENTITTLEEQQVMAARDAEQQQIYWEQRELELEKIVEINEKKNVEERRWNEIHLDQTPDPNLPIAEQLDFSINKIRELSAALQEMKNRLDSSEKGKAQLECSIGEKEQALMARDRIINELRLRMPAASSNRDEILKDILMSDPHLQHSAKVAQQLNDNLKTQLSQKEAELEEYKHLLHNARQDILEANEEHQKMVASLQMKLASKTEEQFMKFKQAALDEMSRPGGKVPGEAELRRLAELEDLVAEQGNIMSALNNNINQANRNTERVRVEMNAEIDRIQGEKQALTAEHETEKQRLLKNIDAQSEEIAHLRQQVEAGQVELELARSENQRAPTTAMRNMVDKLKRQLDEKDSKMKALSKALTELRADMVKTAANNVKSRANDTEEQLNIQKIVDKETAHLKEQLEERNGKLEKLKAVVRKCKEQEVELQAQLSAANNIIKRKDDQLANKPERDVPFTMSTSEATASKTQRAINDEGKKWQVKLDAAKEKLRLKTAECERLGRSVELLKENLARADRERHTRSAKQSQQTGQDADLLHQLETSRRQTLELQEELGALKRQALLGPDAALEELQLKNRILQDRVDELQEEVSLRTPRKDGQAGLQDAYSRLIAREEQLQYENLKLAEENIDLKFQAESAKMEMPQLTKKMESLQQQVVALSSELENKPVRERKIVGSTGKTVAELERTIGLMKKVMERIQAENEQLKKAPGVVNSMRIEELERENKHVKEELARCREAVGGTLASRYDSVQLGTAKVRAENERLVLELTRERDALASATDRISRLESRLEEAALAHTKLSEENEKLRKDYSSTLRATASSSRTRGK